MKRTVEYKHEVRPFNGRGVFAVLIAREREIRICKGDEVIWMSREEAECLAKDLASFVESTSDAGETPAAWVPRQAKP